VVRTSSGRDGVFVVRAGVAIPGHASRRLWRRFRASVVICLLVVVPMVATVAAPGVHTRLRASLGSSWDLLAKGEVWRLFTSTFVQSGPGFVAGIVVLVWLVPLAEWRVGARVTVLAFLLGDWVSSLLVLAGARGAAALGSDVASHVVSHLDSGASAACYACAGAFVISFPAGRLRAVLIGVVVSDLVLEAVITHMLAEIQHPIAVVVGMTIVGIASRPSRSRQLAPVSSAADENTGSGDGAAPHESRDDPSSTTALRSVLQIHGRLAGRGRNRSREARHLTRRPHVGGRLLAMPSGQAL
jgi:hypothetical protein